MYFYTSNKRGAQRRDLRGEKYIKPRAIPSNGTALRSKLEDRSISTQMCDEANRKQDQSTAELLAVQTQESLRHFHRA